jgi:hypothetical protein
MDRNRVDRTDLPPERERTRVHRAGGRADRTMLRRRPQPAPGRRGMPRSSSTSTTHVPPWRAGGRRIRLTALTASALLTVASCSAGHGPDANDRAIAIYSVVIRTVTQPAGGPPTTVAHAPVFVVAADTRSRLSLEVQAGIVEELHDFATIRFVDKRAEAIDETDPRKAVADRGILLTLGKIPSGSSDVNVQVQRYERAGTTASYTVSLHLSGSTWTLARLTP